MTPQIVQTEKEVFVLVKEQHRIKSKNQFDTTNNYCNNNNNNNPALLRLNKVIRKATALYISLAIASSRSSKCPSVT